MKNKQYFNPMTKEEADFYGVKFDGKSDNASIRALEVRQKEEAHMKKKINTLREEADYYGLRIRNMQPAMVTFQTVDHLERVLTSELENFDAQNDDYAYDENGVSSPAQRQLEMEAETANLTKKSVEQVAADARDTNEKKPINKGLLVGGAAVAAYLLFGGN